MPMKTLNRRGDASAHDLVSSGHVNRDSPWSFDAEDGNKLLGTNGTDWTRYAAAHLAIDPSAPEKTREHYGYPFAKLVGNQLTLFRSAIVAIRQRSAQQGAEGIFAAAGRLLTAIDKRGQKAALPDPSLVAQPEQFEILGEMVLSVESADSTDTGPPKAPRFTMVANTGAPMRVGGWRYPVVMDLEGITIPSQTRPIRLNHNSDQGVGHSDRIAMEGGELVAAGVISRDTPAACDVIGSARNGFPWQASIGSSADEVQYVKEGEQVSVNGKQYSGPLNVIRKSTLGEISFVDLGADHNTCAKVAAMKDGELVEPSGTEVPTDGAEQMNRSIANAKAERNRQAGIAALVEEAISFRGADIPEIERLAAEAISARTSVKDFELLLLRATRPRAPQVRRDDLPTPKVLEASLCMAMGLSDERLSKDRDYGPEVVQRAWPLRNRGLRGTIAAALEAAGVRVPHGSRELFDSVLEAQRIQASGFSTVNLPGILGNVANKVLLMAFTEVDATYERVAELADFANFFTHSIFRLGVNGEFERVANDGQIKHAQLGQDAYTNKLDTYGRMLTITRQDIINDDLNSFRSLTAQLARKARIAVEKALYSLVMESGDAFYTVARGNRLTGALGIPELAAAEAAILAQADADGDPIYATPKILLVPPGLKYLADQVFTSAFLQNFALAPTAALPTDNPFRGRFTVESSPFMSSAALPGNSPTTWYLLADPNVLPAFQVAFLDGRRAPTVETADAEFSTLGLSMRCYFDFGLAQLDYRGAVKSTAS